MKRLLVILAFFIASLVPVTIYASHAAATSPQACRVNPIDRTIYCYQIVGPPGNFVDFFHGSMHNVSNNCVNTIMVAVKGQWNVWSRIYTLRPGAFVYWYFNVYERLPPGVYRAIFWDLGWGTVYGMNWWVA